MFQYKDIYIAELTNPHYGELDINKLNELGENGWELVAIVSGKCIFKRAIITHST